MRAPFLREAIARHYASRGVALDPSEVFVSSGASDELGDILDLFDASSPALVMEPAYPAYVDANVIAGRRIVRLESGKDDGFAPWPDPSAEADLIYLCSPGNPTGAYFTRDKLKAWIDFANARGAVILFDAAYEAFVEDAGAPHSIFEVDGARTCAIEICSLSKTAGFTGTRLGYTVIPLDLERGGMRLADMWVRNRTTKTNGVSCIVQKGAAAVFTPEGRLQVERNIAAYKAQRARHHGGARRCRRVVLRRRERPICVDGVPAEHGQLGVLRLPSRERPGGRNAGLGGSARVARGISASRRSAARPTPSRLCAACVRCSRSPSAPGASRSLPLILPVPSFLQRYNRRCVMTAPVSRVRRAGDGA